MYFEGESGRSINKEMACAQFFVSLLGNTLIKTQSVGEGDMITRAAPKIRDKFI